jgi:ABC-type sugar transport system permease subunit
MTLNQQQLLQSWSSFMGLELSYPSSDLYRTLSSWTTQTQRSKLSQIFVSTWRTSPMKFQTSCMHWRNCRCICWPKLRPISAQVLLSTHPKTKTKQKKTPIVKNYFLERISLTTLETYMELETEDLSRFE